MGTGEVAEFAEESKQKLALLSREGTKNEA